MVIYKSCFLYVETAFVMYRPHSTSKGAKVYDSVELFNRTSINEVH